MLVPQEGGWYKIPAIPVPMAELKVLLFFLIDLFDFVAECFEPLHSSAQHN